MSAPTKGIESQTSVPGPSTSAGRVLRADQLHLLPKPLREWKKLISSISISLMIHACVMFILSWFYFDLPHRLNWDSILMLGGSDQEPIGEDVEIDFRGANGPLNIPENDPMAEKPMALRDNVEEPQFAMISVTDVAPQSDGKPGGAAAAKVVTNKKVANKKSGVNGKGSGNDAGGNTADAGAAHADHFKGRGKLLKGMLLKRMGGTDASEAAVKRGLEWIKNHQLANGSWNFNHQLNPRCDCDMPGTMEFNPYAATAMALLAFLGAGHTHLEGDYQPEVQKGIDFLLTSYVRAGKGFCFYPPMEGQPMFYTHGLATIALSEALAMTGDEALRQPVTGAIEYLAATQESGGGWRYFPGQPGDTSVVAWELMALKSAQFSRINVPPKVFRGIDRFIGSVSSMRGSQFAYAPDRQSYPTPSMTAAGLLCRMYLNAKEGPGGLQAGVQLLDQRGPDPDNMYYNYYATQVMHHWGGLEWDRWNNVMREHLIQTQIQEGHAKGSWDVADRHGHAGGRLYMTSLALLTLEVYYRHLPLYHRERIDIPLLKPGADEKVP